MRRTCCAVAVVACMVTFWCGGRQTASAAETWKKSYVITFPAGTRSFHFESTGDVVPEGTSGANSQPTNPQLTDQNGQPLPVSGYGTGGMRNTFIWSNAVSGKYTLTVKAGTQIKNLRYWFDTSGSSNNDWTQPPDGKFASLNPQNNSGVVSLFGENLAGTANASIGTITGTLVDGYG